MIAWIALSIGVSSGFLLGAMWASRPRDITPPEPLTRDGYWRIKFEEECG